MYDEHGPSTTRIIVTIASAVGVIALLIAVSAVVAGVFFSHSASVAADQPLASASVEPSANVTSNTDTSSEPALTPPSQPSSAPAAVPGPAPAPAATTPAPSAAPAQASGIVVIDAGHQGTLDKGMEPNHPGSGAPLKMKVAGGATGNFTHVDESERNLQIALKLRDVLQARGVTVVMIRTTQDVDISNKQRAEIANAKHAALFIRLHCDSATSSSVHGILMLRPATNWFPNHPIVAKSEVAANLVQASTLKATGAYDRGITPRSDETGFNWAQVPSVLIEMGVMSNRADDTALGQASYQEKLASGMANGIVEFLNRK